MVILKYLAEDLAQFKFSPITSVQDMERSFFKYKYFLSDYNRRPFNFDNIKYGTKSF